MCCAKCAVVPILRLIALAVLTVGFAACMVGFVSPFWALYDPGLPDGRSLAAAGDGDGDGGSFSLSTTTPTGAPPLRGAETEGLWGRCDATNYTICTWIWQNDFQLEKTLPVWHKAAQVLYLVGFVILFITILMACVHVCCGCCKETTSLTTILGIMTALGVLAIAASIIVYGALACVERGVNISGGRRETSGDVAAAAAEDKEVDDVADVVRAAVAHHFDWAYYVSMTGAMVASLAVGLFFCDGRRAWSDGSADGRGHNRDGYEAAASMEM
jgi:Na+-transporting methylmalonyl-CoA/oxaloacetate decarboxylase gamma subunit